MQRAVARRVSRPASPNEGLVAGRTAPDDFAACEITDVTDMASVVAEAHELVDDGLMTADDFRDFAFANTVRLLGGMNPQFFDGTAVEAEAAAVLADG